MRLIESGSTSGFYCPTVETFDQHRLDWAAGSIFVVSLNLACACRILPSRMRNRPGRVRRDRHSGNEFLPVCPMGHLMDISFENGTSLSRTYTTCRFSGILSSATRLTWTSRSLLSDLSADSSHRSVAFFEGARVSVDGDSMRVIVGRSDAVLHRRRPRTLDRACG
jgi:hypothetical protein